ncbi:uncharacterized protein LOC119672368 [Teleopsis dalmanni]|uniref:uncharacterized protein LOC119672368 n=1 Tax=Teleopsis dalmanni TaxID=139649 RepID=UPI0018CD69CB|nr:uncharacterized protein LOC119672368 [Teleopsis dalmanni]
MSFLFAPIPSNNFEMSDRELLLWQRKAIFECECENLTNQRKLILSGDQRFIIEQAALQAALQEHGLQMRQPANHNAGAQSPPTQRRNYRPYFRNQRRRLHSDYI